MHAALEARCGHGARVQCACSEAPWGAGDAALGASGSTQSTHTPYMSMMIRDERNTQSHLQPLCLLAPYCLAAPQHHCLAAPRPLLLAQIVMNQRRRGLASSPTASSSRQSRLRLASLPLAARLAAYLGLREASAAALASLSSLSSLSDAHVIALRKETALFGVKRPPR